MHTLLLADDSVTIRRVIELTFAEEDVRVVAVSDGDQAIQRLETAPPDIVLADIEMPGRNGYEVARYVKQSPRLAHIPVVLLAGAFEPVDQLRASEADGILAKPFEPHLVISRVQELLAARQKPLAPLDEGLSALLDRQPVLTPLSAREVASGNEQAARADELDEYFDRLGAAFADRLSVADNAATELVTPPTAPEPGIADWFAAAAESGGELWDPPALAAAEHARDGADSTSPHSTFEAADWTPVAEDGSARPQGARLVTPEAPVSALPSAVGPESLPALADTFAALLTAEQSEPSSSAMTSSGASSDDIVEQVTRRVLAQLTERVVRNTIADLVSEIAERLVREEIERIKAAIK